MQGFMQGYGFIDNIYAKKRAEARLEQRLDEERNHRIWQRERTSRIDAQNQIDRLRRREAEDDQIARQQEIDAANQAIAGIDPNDYQAQIDALSPYSRNSAVSKRIQELRQAQSRMADDITLARGGGIQAGAAAAAGGAAAGPSGPIQQGEVTAPAQQGDAVVYPNAGMPPEDPVAEANRRYTTEELEALAVTNPQEAAALRDQQISLDQEQNRPDVDLSDPEAYAFQDKFDTQRERNVSKYSAEREVTRSKWDSNLDINSPAGDSFRTQPPNVQISQYYQDRASLSPELQAKGDRLLAPHLSNTIQQSQEILANPNVDPTSPDAINAKRKLRESLALVNARRGYKPLADNGVMGALPVDGRNQELTDKVLQASQTQPGPAAPGTINEIKAENQVLSRGPRNGRVSEAFVSAAWRKYHRGEIDFKTFESYVRTGRPPATPVEEEYHKWGQSVYKSITDPTTGRSTLHKVIHNVDMKSGARNVISDEGQKIIEGLAADLAANLGMKGKGNEFAVEFYNILTEHEVMAQARGYDYSNIGDVSQLWTRYQQLQMISGAIENEFSFRGIGWGNATFEKAYGKSVAAALFDEFEAGDIAELEKPDTTWFGMGGEQVDQPQNLRPISAPGVVEFIRRKHGISEDEMSDAEILAIAEGAMNGDTNP
jgi:hypothetical protein